MSSPKAFTGVAAVNQLNAIRSWLRVHPDAEVILYGDAAGTAATCACYGITHVGEIECSPSGVPRFDAIVEDARGRARHDVQVYLNCDILLSQSMVRAIRLLPFEHFLMIGQRIDLPETATIADGTDDWEDETRRLAFDDMARLHPASGMDYFVFPRGLWTGLAPLTIGRGGYDSALLSHCLRHGIPVVDGTFAIVALHQHHDYGHIPGAVGEVMAGVDAANNKRLHRVGHSPPNVGDATWAISGSRVVRRHSRGDYLREIESFVRYRLGLLMPSYIIRLIWRVIMTLGIYRPAQPTLAAVRDAVFGKE